MMIDELGLNKNLIDKYRSILKKSGEEILEIEGISDKQLKPMTMLENILGSTNIANASIDDSANVSSSTINTIKNESTKPIWRLISHNKIYSELEKEFGLDFANKWFEDQVEGRYYLHNGVSASTLPYCYSFSLRLVAENGLFFIDNMKGGRAKHLSTWVDHVAEFINYASNQLSGAVAIPSMLLWMYKFWKDDIESGHIPLDKAEKERDQAFQKFIFRINQPTVRDGIQSAYVNCQILDRPHLQAFFGGDKFLDGSYMLDCFDEFVDFQKSFLEYVNNLRSEFFYTYPVLTASLKVDKNKDYEDEYVAKYVVKHNMAWQDTNIYNAEEITSLSSCCFDETQKTLTKSSKGVNLMSFKELHESSHKDCRTNFKIFNNGNWLVGNIIKIPRDNKKMFKITTSNNKELFMTEDHINFTFEGDKPTKNLTLNDYIGFNNMASEPIKERDMKLTYEQGVVIGAYLGDGSKDSSKNGMLFSINKDKYTLLKPIIDKAILQLGIEDKELLLGKIRNNVYHCRVSNETFREFIEFWVSGSYSYEKRLNLEAVLQSKDFRKGIIDGMYITDGGNSNRIYSTSHGMIEDLETIMTSLGIVSIIDTSDGTGEGMVVIRGQEFNRNYPVHCIRFYNHNYNRTMKDVYKKKNNSIFFKIKNIEEIIDYNKEYVYCFEMKDKNDPYFTLPNGIITHNCRLVNSVEEISKGKEKIEGFFSSIGGTSISIGSMQINTINFARIAYESNGNFEDYKKILKERLMFSHKLLFVIKNILEELIDNGRLPVYSNGLIDKDRQFMTIGINSLFSSIKFMGGISQNEIGETYYNDTGKSMMNEIFKIINEENSKTLELYGYTANAEQVPAETCGKSLLFKDRLYFKNEITENTKIYENQWIPLTSKASLKDRIETCASYDPKCGGGAIGHFNIGEPIENFEDAWNLAKHIAKQGVIYYSLIHKFSYCKNEHSFYGEICPICGDERKGYGIKIVGYIVKSENFHDLRKEELENRVFYNI